MSITFPLRPRDPEIGLFVVAIGRISDPKQNVENINASYKYVDDRLDAAVPEEKTIKYLGEQSSGYIVDRATMLELEDLIEQDTVDLIVAEDLSRIYRNPRLQYSFVQDAFDRRVHVICFGDGLDTRDENWEVILGAAALRHGLMIPDTVRRVRRTATNAFHKGGMVTKYRFGYRKLSKEEAQSGMFGPVGLRIAKLIEWTPILHEMRVRVLTGESYNALALWLKEAGIPAGPYVGPGGWAGRLVRDLLASPILSGTRQFRRTLFDRLFKTGHHQRIRNETPEEAYCPTLAHFTEEEHAELLEAMLARVEVHNRKKGKDHPLFRRSRTDTRFPGQHLRCLCGEVMYFNTNCMKCKNTLPGGPKTCWNHVQVPLETLRDRFVEWLVSLLDAHPGVRELVATAACEEIRRSSEKANRSGRADLKLIEELKEQARSLAKAIAKNRESEALQEELAAVEKKAAALTKRMDRRETGCVLDNVENPQDVSDNLHEVVRTMAESSFGFGKLMQKLLPVFYVQPIQTLDRPQVHARVKLTFSTAAFCKAGEEPFEVSASLDVGKPAEYITNVHRNMERCREIQQRDPKLNLNQIAKLIGIHPMELKRSRMYAKLMEERRTSDPFIELTAPPEKASRWRNVRKDDQQSTDAT